MTLMANVERCGLVSIHSQKWPRTRRRQMAEFKGQHYHKSTVGFGWFSLWQGTTSSAGQALDKELRMTSGIMP